MFRYLLHNLLSWVANIHNSGTVYSMNGPIHFLPIQLESGCKGSSSSRCSHLNIKRSYYWGPSWNFPKKPDIPRLCEPGAYFLLTDYDATGLQMVRKWKRKLKQLVRLLLVRLQSFLQGRGRVVVGGPWRGILAMTIYSFAHKVGFKKCVCLCPLRLLPTIVRTIVTASLHTHSNRLTHQSVCINDHSSDLSNYLIFIS